MTKSTTTPTYRVAAPTPCHDWCVYRDDHTDGDSIPVCMGETRPVVLSDPAQQCTSPVVYGVQVRGSESPRITIDRGEAPMFELTTTEATRLAYALLDSVKEVTA